MVFEVYNAEQFGLVEDRQADDRFRLLPQDVWVRGKSSVAPCIVEAHRLAGALDILDDPPRDFLAGFEGHRGQTRDPAESHISPHDDQPAAVVLPEEHPALGPRMLDDEGHHRLQQPVQCDFAGQGLGGFQGRGQVEGGASDRRRFDGPDLR